MSKKMLIDAAHPEEVRVAVLSQNKIEDFDFESAARRPLRGNIFLARVTRVEPSLQAAFVDYGGNRHGFLAFSEIHPDYYQIPVSDRQALQAAEKEVAELAAELELAQRGDEEDDEENDRDDDSADADENEDQKAEASDDEDSGDNENGDGEEDKKKAALSDGISDDDAVKTEEEEEEEEEDEHASIAAPATDLKKDEDAEKEDEDVAAEAAAEDGEAVLDAEEVDAAGEDEAEDNDDDEEDDAANDDQDENGEGGDDEAKSKRAQREALFERYKDAKRKRAQLLRNYKIQEVIKRRQILLIQVVKEERGNKGAALTTYLSLAGRYCVLMPNTARGGGISRKIANGSDRRRLRRVVDSLDVPQGMGLIIRTAGSKRTKTEIKRDYDYLLRMWENIRSLTLKSIAPCLIYEEASLIKRAIRDLYDKDISKVMVEGEEGYREAKDFMKMLMPSHAKNVQPHKDKAPIFLKHGVETQLDGMYQPSVRLKSGGYLVIHVTEALVAIDVNSGRATRERNIEQTALKTNLEAAEEAARQFRLRDLAGLVVIDFIDMEEPRNNRKVEKALKEALKTDRARLQVGRISPFGLLELSRQRRRSGIQDGTTQSCPTCSGAGVIRSHEMAALRILRAVEGEAISGKVGLIAVRTSTDVALHMLNHNRDWIRRIEDDNGVSIEIIADPEKHGDDYGLEKSGAPRERKDARQVVRADQTEPVSVDEDEEDNQEDDRNADASSEDKPKKRRRRRRSRRDKEDGDETSSTDNEDGEENEARSNDDDDAEREDKPKKRRRRGRRGGRRNRRDNDNNEAGDNGDASKEGDQAKTDAPRGGEHDQADEQPAMSAETPTAPDSVEAAETAIAPEPEPQPEAVSSKTPEAESDAAEEAPKAKKTTRRGWWNRSAS